MSTVLDNNVEQPATSGRLNRFDVAIIGGGAVGLGTALNLLQQYRLRLVVLEAEQLAAHQTGHNSGVIHSGLYYRPGSLKAQLCVQGREKLYQFCAKHGVPHERCGKIVVASDESELAALAELERRGRANGLQGIRRLSPAQLRELEPQVAGIEGLFVAETGIVDFAVVAQAYGKEVQNLGGEIRTGWQLRSVRQAGEKLILQTSQGDVECSALVNCAGLQSDRVARMCGSEPTVRIVPFRGEYYKLRPQAHHLVRNLIYPVPDPRFPFLGVHFTRMAKGGIEAGPNAVLALARHGYKWTDINLRDLASTATFPGFWKMAAKYWKTGSGEVWRSISKPAFVKALQKLVPAITADDLEPGGAGVRAQALDPSGALVDDFRIIEDPRMIHVLNAPSPAATASLAIGQVIAETASRNLSLSRRTGGV